MRIAYFAPFPRSIPRLGVYYGDKIVDLVDSYKELYGTQPPHWFYDLGDFLSNEKYSFKVIEEILTTISPSALKESSTSYDPENVIYYPLTHRDQRVFCLALNYKSHAAETRSPLPEVPYVFTKFKTALVGHKQPVLIPRASTAVDYEVELGVVIGKKGKYISRDNAFEHIAGYTVFNDISFRDWQFMSHPRLGLNWLHGKNMDSSTPVGPCLVTKDEVKDVYSLELVLKVNGVEKQHGHTSDMIFGIEEIVKYISQGIKLIPGDLIATGTPAGVGHIKREYLNDGDIIEAEITNIGTLINPVVKEK